MADTNTGGNVYTGQMVTLGYLGTATVVLALCWGAIELTRMPVGTPPVAAVVAVFALIAITPLCGLMFGCGCAWPWDGLHFHCNVFDADAALKCPWCKSMVAGGLSMLGVFGASIFAAYRAASAGANSHSRFTLGVLAGAVSFHFASFVTGALAALATGHSLPFTA